MPSTATQTIHDVLAATITLLAVALALALLVGHLRRRRPGLRIGVPVATALVLRVLAAAGVSLLPIASTLRGGDELAFTGRASLTAQTPFGSPDWIDALVHDLHEFVFALQYLVLDSPEFALRIGQAGIAVVALVLLAAAVHELAGGRAAWLAAWLLALEPAGIFFSTLLHKESIMILAAALVAYGGAVLWKHADLRDLAVMALGCGLALATRPYAGWFLIAAAAAISLHAGLRARREASVRSLVLVAAIVLLAAISAPTILEASTDENLEKNLQGSQEANAADEEANLSLERVDFSTRSAIITNLPIRIWDVLLRPYPWQVGSASQQVAVVGTLFFLVAMVLLVRCLTRNRGAIMERAGPFLYVGAFLLVAYALSTGNAGTAFRYRTQVVALGICALAALWYMGVRADKRAARPEPPPAATRWRRPVPAID